jgi:site-specific DNA recombinase
VQAAVLYGRNSSAPQKSIDEQSTENRAAATEHGWRVADELDDPFSASRYSTRTRKNWARLLELLPTVDVIVLWEPSRGDRSLASWAAFLDSCRQHQVRIHATSHGRTYDPGNARDYRSLAEDGVDSAYESDKTSARVRRSKAAAAVQGLPLGSIVYGYTRRYDPSSKKYAGDVERPEHAAVVRDIIGSLAAGETISSITTRLNKARVPTPRGAAYWQPSAIRYVATNPVYRPHPDDPQRGCCHRFGELSVGTWPPLVEEMTWQACQTVLGTRDATVRLARRGAAPGQVKHLLSASKRLLQAPCGAILAGIGDRPGRRGFYVCQGEQCVTVTMAEADEYVTRLVVARLSRKDARHLWAADNTASRQAAGELARLRAELEEARASFAAPGGISAAALALKEQAMGPAIADAERRAQPVGAPLAAVKLLDAAKLSKDLVRPTWDALPVTERREIIGGVFSSLILRPATQRLTKWTPAEERLEIVAARITHDWRRPATTRTAA